MLDSLPQFFYLDGWNRCPFQRLSFSTSPCSLSRDRLLTSLQEYANVLLQDFAAKSLQHQVQNLRRKAIAAETSAGGSATGVSPPKKRTSKKQKEFMTEMEKINLACAPRALYDQSATPTMDVATTATAIAAASYKAFSRGTFLPPRPSL